MQGRAATVRLAAVDSEQRHSPSGITWKIQLSDRGSEHAYLLPDGTNERAPDWLSKVGAFAGGSPERDSVLWGKSQAELVIISAGLALGFQSVESTVGVELAGHVERCLMRGKKTAGQWSW